MAHPESLRVWRQAAGDPASLLPGGAVTAIGSFDVLHRGHRALLEGVVKRAQALAAPAQVLSFEPHPRTVLQPSGAPRRLLTDRQREGLLAAWGIDSLILLHFDRELADVPAEEFIERQLVDLLAVREVHVGTDFRFGRGRGGDVGSLQAAGFHRGFAVRALEPLRDAGGVISSSRVRAAWTAGSISAVAALLGRPPAIEGTVVRGDGRGRALGWPTANLLPHNELLPATGVYAARCRRPRTLAGTLAAVNLGHRPTFGNDGVLHCEAHLLDFDGDLYGAELELELHDRLRGERRFPDLHALRAGIRDDVAFVREYFLPVAR